MLRMMVVVLVVRRRDSGCSKREWRRQASCGLHRGMDAGDAWLAVVDTRIRSSFGLEQY